MSGDEHRDRHAYLEEQIQRQKRGEPVDVEWVAAELERVRREVASKRAAIQRNLLWLVIGSAALMLVLWIRGGGPNQPGGAMWLAAILIGLLAAWGLTRRRRD